MEEFFYEITIPTDLIFLMIEVTSKKNYFWMIKKFFSDAKSLELLRHKFAFIKFSKHY